MRFHDENLSVLGGWFYCEKRYISLLHLSSFQTRQNRGKWLVKNKL